MKQIFYLILTTMLLPLLSTASASAQRMIVTAKDGSITKFNVNELEKVVFEPKKEFDPSNLLSEEYIPCEAFRDWIDANIGDGSGYYSIEDAAKYNGKIDISYTHPDITDITGIEYFTSLTEFNGEDGYFGDFNVGALKGLKTLRVVNTKCTTLDLSGLDNLTKASVSRNKLTSLTLPKSGSLKYLWCDSNELYYIDLSDCNNLIEFVASFNSLTSIVLPECPLKTLAIHNNYIKEIDLSNVKSTLDFLNVSSCGLTALDLTDCNKLTYMECSDNSFTTAPVFANCTKLETIRMENNNLEMGTLDLSSCSALNVLRVDFSKIGDSIDLSNNLRLYEFSVQGCGLSSINISPCYNLGYVNVTSNNFKRLDVSACDGIYSLFANSCPENAEIKVWPDFDIANPESMSFYTNCKCVYEFTSESE